MEYVAPPVYPFKDHINGLVGRKKYVTHHISNEHPPHFEDSIPVFGTIVHDCEALGYKIHGNPGTRCRFCKEEQ